MTEESNVERALKLEEGCTYVIEVDGFLTKERRDTLADSLKQVSDELHVRFVILDGGLKIAKEGCEAL